MAELHTITSNGCPVYFSSSSLVVLNPGCCQFCPQPPKSTFFNQQTQTSSSFCGVLMHVWKAISHCFSTRIMATKSLFTGALLGHVCLKGTLQTVMRFGRINLPLELIILPYWNFAGLPTRLVAL